MGPTTDDEAHHGAAPAGPPAPVLRAGAVHGTVRTVLTVLLAGVLLVALASHPVEAVIERHVGVVDADPVGRTPHVLQGQARALAQSGSRIYVAGDFQQVRDSSDNGGAVHAQPYLFAFDRDTGAVDTGFRPVIGDDLEALAVSDDGRSLYIGGYFSTVDGTTQNKIAKIDAVTGAVDTSFTASSNSRVFDIVQRHGRVFAAGNFSAINGIPRSLVAELDPDTGEALDSFQHTFSRPYTGAMSIKSIDVSPDAGRLAVVGNFGAVDGQPRESIAQFDVSGDHSTLHGWQTDEYGQDYCSPSFDTYMKDVEFSPDGSFFVVVTTGGPRGDLCDTAARWETETDTPGAQPTWVSTTGGDTLWSVGVAGDVVYLGGHQRWLNNPFGRDHPGPGAVAREGIGAVDARNGVPLSWNPGRTRGVGLFDFLTAPEGLYAVSDTDRWFTYEYHGRLALFPGGGSQLPAEVPGRIPGTLMSIDPTDGTVRLTSFDGADTGDSTTFTSGLAGIRDGFMISGELFSAHGDGTLRRRPVDDRTVGPATTIDLNGLGSDHFPVASLTGLTYDPVTGRILYTVQGDSRLFSRGFLPESGIVSAENIETQTALPGLDWSRVRGLHLAPADGHLYAGSADGDLRRVDVVDGVAQGTPRIVSGPGVDGLDWADSLTVYADADAEPVNVAPTAAITASCDGGDCTLSALGSQDPDGDIVDHQWDLGDGTTASGELVQHTFPEGDWTVTLTVTDDRGASGAATQVVSHSAVPEAVVDVSCRALACSFDGSRSSDAGESVVAWHWTLGDGTAAAGEVVEHDYATPGTYAVELTVTDDEGQEATTTTSVTVDEPDEAISWVGSDSATGRDLVFGVTVPGDVRSGDLLMLLVSSSRPGIGDAAPTGVDGWTNQDTIINGSATVAVWTRVADGSEAGRTVSVDMEGLSTKADVTVAAWRGVDPDAPLLVSTGSAETVSRTEHTTPSAFVDGDGAWVVSYWTDRTSRTTDWVAPAGVTVRHEGHTSGGGRASALLADSGAPVPAGPVGGLTATADSANEKATTWTFALAPSSFEPGEPEPPVAAIEASCVEWDCTLDGSASTGVDDALVAWSWDLGDGTTATGETVSHGYGSDGVYTATLTVTDESGLQDTASVTVEVAAEPRPPVAAATVTCDDLRCTFDGSASTGVDDAIAAWSWDLGDGATDAGEVVQHRYTAGGTFDAVLTVVDEQGLTDTVTVRATPSEPPPAGEVSFVGAAAATGRTDQFEVTVPEAVAPGDLLMLFVSSGVAEVGDEPPTGVTGWQRQDTLVNGSATVSVWWQVADGDEAGATVAVDMEGVWTKADVTVLAYRGVDTAAPLAAAAAEAETVDRAEHTTPEVAVDVAGSWVVSYWTDRTSATTSWTAPAGVTVRHEGHTSGGGRASALIADSGTDVAQGTVGGLTATADSANHKATMWTFALTPAP